MPQYHAKQKQQQQQLHDIWAHFVFGFPGFLIPGRINWTAATTTTTQSKWNPMDEEKRKKKERSKIEDCYLWRLVFLPPPLAAGRGSHYVLALKQFEQPSQPSKFSAYPVPVPVSIPICLVAKTNERKSFKSTNGHYLSLKPFSRCNYNFRPEEHKKGNRPSPAK